MSRKQQLLALFFLLFVAAAALILLKENNRTASEETVKEEENYPVTEIDPSQVKEIGIINGEDTVNLVREGEEWKCREKEEGSSDETPVDSGLVEDFLTKASSITALRKIEDGADLSEYGLESPSVNITLQWEDNMYIIRLGDYNSIIGSYYLSINEDKTVYTIDNATYYSLDKTLDDFLKTEPE